jgi:peptide/nickel transport system substrate-binding protein
MLHPVGTGSYKFVSYTRSVSLKYARFDQSWHGKPYLDGIEFYFQADPVTAVAAFLAGEGDAVGTLNPADAANLKRMGKFELRAATSNVVAIGGDGKNPDSPFADLRVRQALAYAIDADAARESVGLGFYTPTNQATHSIRWDYNPNIKGYPYNPAKAKELLAAAGYPNGFKTTLTYNSSSVAMGQAVLITQRYLKEVGIETTLVPMTASGFTAFESKGYTGLVARYILVSVGYGPFNERLYFNSGRPYTVSNFWTQAIDDQYNKAVRDQDQAQMVKDMQEYHRLIIDEYAIVKPLYVEAFILARYPYVVDIGSMYEPFSSGWTPWTAWMAKH